MAQTDLEAKIAKLLALAAGNANIHEASAAFARAQAIADRHAIDLESIRIERGESGQPADSPVSERAEIARKRIDGWGKRIGWRCMLVTKIAHANGCRSYTSGSCVYAYGPADRLDTIAMLYHWISREIDRLGKIYARGRGRGAGTSYRMGAVHEVGTRLQAERAKTLQSAKTEAYQTGGENALVRVSTAIARQDRTADVERYARLNLNLRSGRGFSGGTSGEGYAAGRAAGRTMSVKPAGQIG